jgi:hypothetical protein
MLTFRQFKLIRQFQKDDLRYGIHEPNILYSFLGKDSESFETRVFFWFSTLVFPFSKMLFKNSISNSGCRSVVFNVEKVSRREPGLYCEMSSFPETKAERLMFGVNGDPAMFLWFHRYGSAHSRASLRKCLFRSLVLRIRDTVFFDPGIRDG